MKTWIVCGFAFVLAAGCGGDDSSGGGQSGKGGASAGHAGAAGRAGGGHGGSAAHAGRGGSGGTVAGMSGEGGVAPEAGTGNLPNSGEAGMPTGTSGESGGGGEGGAAVATAWEIDAPTFSVASGDEQTLCAVVELGNERPIHAGALHVTTSNAVFELTIGATSMGSTGAPSTCDSFSEFQDAGVTPLLFTRQRSEDIVLPTGDGYTLNAHQLVRFEVHTLNLTSGSLDAQVHLRVEAIADSAYEREAGLVLVENADFSVPVGGTSMADAYFPSSKLGVASMFRAVGNVHKLGTRVTLSTGASDSGPFTSFYDEPVSDVPAPLQLTPAVSIPDTGGIKLECDYNNAGGTASVNPGPTSADERCMGFLYHAPALSTRMCVLFGGTIVC